MRQLEENAKKIEAEINLLEKRHWDWFERVYKDFWIHAKEISHLFRSLSIAKEDRERLWSRFSAICEKVKRELNEKNEKRRYRSNEHRKDILREAKSADIGIIKIVWPSDAKEMKILGQRLKEAGNMLLEKKKEMLGEHKQECFEYIKEVRERHDHWWGERKKRSTERLRIFREKIKSNLEKNYERREKAVRALEKLRAHADDLRNKIDSAWNDEFKERAMQWLSETEEKIEDIEKSILEIENWIEEDERKLSY